jgi:hypothetical protein
MTWVCVHLLTQPATTMLEEFWHSLVLADDEYGCTGSPPNDYNTLTFSVPMLDVV